MTDLPPQSRSDDDTGTPRWVKVFGTISLVVVVLFLIMLFAGGGRHGPGRHRPAPSDAEPAVRQP